MLAGPLQFGPVDRRACPLSTMPFEGATRSFGARGGRVRHSSASFAGKWGMMAREWPAAQRGEGQMGNVG